MGMIFNTPATTNLIAAINKAFTGKRFADILRNQPAEFGNLQNLGGPNTFYDNVWRALNIDECGVSVRLKFWLGLLDSEEFKQEYNGKKDYLSGWMGKGIYQAISNPNNYAGVEFFAVPGTLKNITLALPITPFSDSENKGKLTQIITVYTDIVDNFPGHPPRTSATRRRN